MPLFFSGMSSDKVRVKEVVALLHLWAGDLSVPEKVVEKALELSPDPHVAAQLIINALREPELHSGYSSSYWRPWVTGLEG